MGVQTRRRARTAQEGPVTQIQGVRGSLKRKQISAKAGGRRETVRGGKLFWEMRTAGLISWAWRMIPALEF